ncbi:MAG TPA: hypothetical protein HA224_05040 [Nanoarchaeota archaeon]|nr:hypothetical protein [Nanoarchaeota archaeon]
MNLTDIVKSELVKSRLHWLVDTDWQDAGFIERIMRIIKRQGGMLDYQRQAKVLAERKGYLEKFGMIAVAIEFLTIPAILIVAPGMYAVYVSGALIAAGITGATIKNLKNQRKFYETLANKSLENSF